MANGESSSLDDLGGPHDYHCLSKTEMHAVLLAEGQDAVVNLALRHEKNIKHTASVSL